MYTSYEKIYENLLPKFRDYDIPDMTLEQVKDYLHDYLAPAIARFHVCRKDLNDRDDILERFNVKLDTDEVEILSNYCLLEYIDSTYIRVPTLLKVSLSSSDFNAFSNANLLDKMMAMRNKYLAENEALISRYAWLGARENGISLGAGYKKNKNSFNEYEF